MPAASRRIKILRLTKSVSRSALGFMEWNCWFLFFRAFGWSFTGVEPVLLSLWRFILFYFLNAKRNWGGEMEKKRNELLNALFAFCSNNKFQLFSDLLSADKNFCVLHFKICFPAHLFVEHTAWSSLVSLCRWKLFACECTVWKKAFFKFQKFVLF